MILTVTPNTALDLTYEVPGLALNATNRVRAVHARAGGKGLNVARTLVALGHEVTATGFAGGPNGALFLADLADVPGLRARFTPIAGETRRTLALVDADRDQTTMLTEPGPLVSAAEVASLVGAVTALSVGVDAVVLAGSLPPGAPPDLYATLAAATSAPVFLDADADALRHGVAGLARPFGVATPNAAELRLATGEDSVRAGALALLRGGADAVVVSLGADGAVAFTRDDAWHATTPPVAGNPTGAGDALVAGLVAGLGLDWPQRLTRAVALAGATVAASVAGEFSRQVYARLLREVQVRRLTPDDEARSWV